MELKNRPLQSSGRPREDASGGARHTQGTVLSVSPDGKGNKVLVQFPHGRMELKVAEEFETGDKVRLVYLKNGSLQIEKLVSESGSTARSSLPVAISAADLPSGLPALLGLHAKVAAWAGENQPGIGPGKGQGPPSVEWQEKPFMELVRVVLDLPGGKAFLEAALVTLGRDRETLTDSLQKSFDSSRHLSPEMRVLKDLLRVLQASQGGENRTLPSGASHSTASSSRGTAVIPGQEGGGILQFGRILSREILEILPHRPVNQGDSASLDSDGRLFRFQIDTGSARVSAVGHEIAHPGDFEYFKLHKKGDTDFLELIPREIATGGRMAGMLEKKNEAFHPAFQLASNHLQSFANEKYIDDLTFDLGHLLRQSGRLEGARVERQGLPDARELDFFLKMLVTFPRDAGHPNLQAQVWAEVGQNPEVLGNFLRYIAQFEGKDGILQPESQFRLISQNSERGNPPILTLPNGQEILLPSVMETIKLKLGESFRTADLAAAFEAALGYEDPASGASENKASKFLLQALLAALPRDDEFREAGARALFLGQNQAWRPIAIRWDERREDQSKGRKGESRPVQFEISSQGRNIGEVVVNVKVEEEGVTLSLRNQFQDLRPLLPVAMEELEQNLRHIGFRVRSWDYLPWKPAAPIRLNSNPPLYAVNEEDGRMSGTGGAGTVDIRA